ncbi:unnamed protein product, partial [Allacma fusca]
MSLVETMMFFLNHGCKRLTFPLRARLLEFGSTWSGLYVRYYVCDPSCPMDQCEDELEDETSKVCTLIIETDPDGSYVTFPNKCAFDCANKCYEYQLTSKPGGCEPKPKAHEGRNNLDLISEFLKEADPIVPAIPQTQKPKIQVISEDDEDEGADDDEGD